MDKGVWRTIIEGYTWSEDGMRILAVTTGGPLRLS
jgi:hypothetical protein